MSDLDVNFNEEEKREIEKSETPSHSGDPTDKEGGNINPTTHEPEKDLIQEEENNPGLIDINLSDEQTPIVVLFGPPACGKTMTLRRMCQYLHGNNKYIIVPVKSFRASTNATAYEKRCEDFSNTIKDANAAQSTNTFDFMLVSILNESNSRPICQFLEAPGEHYFHPTEERRKPKENFLRYIRKIISSKNRKIWVLFLEYDWGDRTIRDNYVEKIRMLKKQTDKKSSFLIFMNKVDKTFFLNEDGSINIEEAKRQLHGQYHNIFNLFKNTNPITKYFYPYTCKFVPFQTGTYSGETDARDGEKKNVQTYEPSSDKYCKRFWSTLLDMIKG